MTLRREARRLRGAAAARGLPHRPVRAEASGTMRFVHALSRRGPPLGHARPAWPRQFQTWDFWVLKESVHNLLKFGIALELTVRTFRAFPAARKTATGLVLAVLVLTWLSVGADAALEAARHERAGREPPALRARRHAVALPRDLGAHPLVPAAGGAAPQGAAAGLRAVPAGLHGRDQPAPGLRRGTSAPSPATLKTVAYQMLLAYWVYSAWRRWPRRPPAVVSRGAASPPAA